MTVRVRHPRPTRPYPAGATARAGSHRADGARASAPASKAWLGGSPGSWSVALLAGATAVLFVRVQDAQEQADDAVTLAGGNQAQLQTQLDQINADARRRSRDGQADERRRRALTESAHGAEEVREHRARRDRAGRPDRQAGGRHEVLTMLTVGRGGRR